MSQTPTAPAAVVPDELRLLVTCVGVIQQAIKLPKSASECEGWALTFYETTLGRYEINRLSEGTSRYRLNFVTAAAIAGGGVGLKITFSLRGGAR